MPKIMLKLEDQKTGDASNREFEDEAATIAFLKVRPRFTEVLGVVFEGLTPEQNARLKAAMRPLDDEEREASAARDAQRNQAAEAAREQRQKEGDALRTAHREALKSADPNRPMEVRYRYDAGIAAIDPEDTRPISDEVREAVLACVGERAEWVAERGQIIGEAKLTVWPGTLPKPGADRVRGGSFIPLTAPEKAAKPES